MKEQTNKRMNIKMEVCVEFRPQIKIWLQLLERKRKKQLVLIKKI